MGNVGLDERKQGGLDCFRSRMMVRTRQTVLGPKWTHRCVSEALRHGQCYSTYNQSRSRRSLENTQQLPIPRSGYAHVDWRNAKNVQNVIHSIAVSLSVCLSIYMQARSVQDDDQTTNKQPSSAPICSDLNEPYRDACNYCQCQTGTPNAVLFPISNIEQGLLTS